MNLFITSDYLNKSHRTISYFYVGFICFLLLLTPENGLNAQGSQDAQIDSLRQVANSKAHDTIRTKALKAWDNLIYASDPDLDFKLTNQIISICSENLSKSISAKEVGFYKEHLGNSYNVIGMYYRSRAQPDSASFYFKKSIKIQRENGNEIGVANALSNLGVLFKINGDYEKALNYYKQSLEISKRIKNDKSTAITYGNIAQIHRIQGNFNKALLFQHMALNLMKDSKDQFVVAGMLGNIGNIHLRQGDYKKAIDFYDKSLKLREEIGDQNGAANLNSNIGLIYEQQGDFNMAQKYYQSSLAILEDLNDAIGMSNVYINLGTIYQNGKNYDTALDYFNKSLEIELKYDNKENIATCLLHIGSILMTRGQIDEASKKLLEAYSLAKIIDNKELIAKCSNNLCSYYFQIKLYDQCMHYGEECMEIALKLELTVLKKDCGLTLFECYMALNKKAKALDYFLIHTQARDLILSEENQKEVIAQAYRHAYEKKAAEDSIINENKAKLNKAESALKEAKIIQLEEEEKQQKTQRSYLVAFIIFICIVALFMFNRFRVTKKQKNIIETQKIQVDEAFDKLEEKNKEIIDSINYAERIQNAILPDAQRIKVLLPNSFVYYQPKDIVAGDFYWLEKLENAVVLAVADCTGHGVPGAMVSVVCHNALNRSIKEFSLTTSNAILDKTRELVVETFNENNEDVKDGMDVALTIIDDTRLQFSGANNALYLIRNEELIEYKADKQPIGLYEKAQPFSQNTVNLEENDMIYLFTDGYADQFGGEKGKKFKYKSFKTLLLSISKLPLDEQKMTLEQTIKSWMGKHEQIDDICIIGFRYSSSA